MSSLLGGLEGHLPAGDVSEGCCPVRQLRGEFATSCLIGDTELGQLPDLVGNTGMLQMLGESPEIVRSNRS